MEKDAYATIREDVFEMAETYYDARRMDAFEMPSLKIDYDHGQTRDISPREVPERVRERENERANFERKTEVVAKESNDENDIWKNGRITDISKMIAAAKKKVDRENAERVKTTRTDRDGRGGR